MCVMFCIVRAILGSMVGCGDGHFGKSSIAVMENVDVVRIEY